MRLALLAPDIVEAIVDGREPSGLSLEMLVTKMSVVWEEQRNQHAISGPANRGAGLPRVSAFSSPGDDLPPDTISDVVRCCGVALCENG